VLDNVLFKHFPNSIYTEKGSLPAYRFLAPTDASICISFWADGKHAHYVNQSLQMMPEGIEEDIPTAKIASEVTITEP